MEKKKPEIYEIMHMEKIVAKISANGENENFGRTVYAI